MTAAAAKASAPILRNAAGEPPLGSEGAFFRDDQGEIFRHPVESYRSGATDIGILELDNGEWLAKPPSFAVNRPRYANRELALRAAICAMIRRARKYARNKDGEGTQWSEGYAGRVIEWALSIKEAKQELVQSGGNGADAECDHHSSEVAAASDTDRVIEDSSHEQTGSLNQPTDSDFIVRSLVEAHRARKTYPAGHTFSMTNPVLSGAIKTVGTCSCSHIFVFPGGDHERMDAAIEAHWQKFDASPDKVDGRGQPIGGEAPAVKPKQPRKKKQPDAPEGIPASSIAKAGPIHPMAPRSEPVPSSPGAGSPLSEAAPIGAGSTEVSEPPAYEGLSNAEIDPVREAGFTGGSLALSMAAEPADDWSPMLVAALDLAWRDETAQPDPIKEFERTLPELIGPEEKRRKISEFKLALKQKPVNLGPLFGNVPPPSTAAT